MELDLWLVGLSLVMAFQGSYVGLHLARRIGGAQAAEQRRLIAFSALSLALAIWTMHFVGMLAMSLPYTADYLVLPTLLSFLVCVLVVGVAVFVVSSATLSTLRLALAALFMGSGIVTMHFLGMLALHSRIHMTHDPVLTAAAVVVGISASGMALWFGFGPRAPRSTTASAALLAAGISAMHYLAMGATHFHLLEAPAAEPLPALSSGLLAIVVSVVAFLVSGLFLLSLVPPAQRPSAAAAAAGVDPAGPPAGETEAAGHSAAAPGSATFAATLPVERDGLRRSLEVTRLVAVQAQAHYTQLFDGEERWFCPLTISEVEERLDPALFARIHRSHIVNLDRISGLKRLGDASEVTLVSRVPYRVPVARSRNRWLKDVLQARLAS